MSVELALESTVLDDFSGAMILGATALRTQTLTDSSVTSWWLNLRKGIIDNSVFFTPDCCSHSYVPRVQDHVRVHCIECEPCDQNRNCSWSAVRVVPMGVGNREQPLNTWHLSNPTHSSYLNELLKDKNGVLVHEEIDMGTVQMGESAKHFITVVNSNKFDVFLKNVEVKSDSK